jgi:alpha-galactosidase
MDHRQNAQEQARVQAFTSAHLTAGVHPPFSFTYGGRPSSEYLPGWRCERETRQLDETATEHLVTYTHPQTSLHVRCTCVVYSDYPAIEWVITLKNGSQGDTPLIEDVQALDIELSGEDWMLHRALGSSASRSDFGPVDEPVPLHARMRLAPVGGRSSNTTALPFFNIEAEGEGVMVGIGWSGQWAAELHRQASTSLQVRAGMERTRLKLHAGQEIRTPRILLLFWHGEDRMRGHNMFRQFMLDHHTVRQDGGPIAGPLACNGGPAMFQESNLATAHNQIALAERYRQYGLDTEYWWIDAGWFEGRWPNGVGNWTIRKDGFPDGLRPVSDALAEMGFGLILWFEPERVYRDTWLDREHPDWVLRLPGNPNGLLDLGNPQARRWLTDHVSGMIEREGIAIYRQDFNMDPLPYWRAADEPDGQGLTEIGHVEGLYAFWDELLARHPGLIIDNCASGGRRIDLETASRSIPLWRTDYRYFEPNGYQCHTYGLSFYLPCSGTGSDYPDTYAFRSSMNGALVLGWNLYLPDFPVERARQLIKEFKRLRPFFYGDYYPLTAHSTADDVWMAYQFHREDLGEGMFLAFRRPENPDPSIRLKLGGLDPTARYELDLAGERRTVTGAELGSGIDVTLQEAPGSLLATYRRCQDR